MYGHPPPAPALVLRAGLVILLLREPSPPPPLNSIILCLGYLGYMREYVTSID